MINSERLACLENVQQKLGYTFKDISLLDLALTHTSYSKGDGRDLDHNERLEFLGDAVLELCVSEYLYKTFSDLDEGQMTRVRASTVCENALFEASKRYDLGECLRLSKGERNTGGEQKPSIVSDAMEAVIGAVFLDGGRGAAWSVIFSFVKNPIEKAVINANRVGYRGKDYKTRLQELVQKKSNSQLVYNIVEETGPAHQKRFVMSVELDGRIIGQGEGGSKQEAGRMAAKVALTALGYSEE